MTVTFTVREAAKDLIVANIVKPSLPAGSLTVYNSPEDDDPAGAGPIVLTAFPTIIVQKGLYGDTDSWRRKTQVTTEYIWWLEIIAYLAEEKLPSWQAQKLAEDWQNALANVFLAQPTISGTVDHIVQADGGEFMYTRDGYYDWYTQSTQNPTSYWGVGLRMQVAQDYSFAEVVGVA
jgi:hypothetical protein